MLKEEPNFKSGWKGDHVWSFVKNFEKFKDGYNLAKRDATLCGFGYTYLESKNPTSDHVIQVSTGLSSFSINLGEEDINVNDQLK